MFILVSLQSPVENSRLVDVKPRISDDVDKIKGWKIPDVADPSLIKPLRLPDSGTAAKVGVICDYFLANIVENTFILGCQRLRTGYRE